MIRILAAICAVLALGLAICAWALNIKDNALDATQRRLDEATAKSEQFDRSLTARDGVDQQYQEALSNAQAERDRLSDGIARGDYRVYVNAKCPVQDSTTAGVAHDGRAELDPADGQRVAALRAGIQRLEAKVTGLQRYIREVCRGPQEDS